MYLSELWSSIRRRWYLVAFGLLVTAVGCVGVGRLVATEYVAKASLLLLPPSTTVGTGGNPYLSLGGLQGAADVLARAMTDSAIADDLLEDAADASYTVEPDATTSAPMFVVEARSTDPQTSLALLDDLTALAPETLRSLQEEIQAPERSFIQLSVVTHETTATADAKTQLRALILVGVVGVVITFFGTSFVDGAIRRRASRPTRAAQRAPDTESAARDENGATPSSSTLEVTRHSSQVDPQDQPNE